MAPDSHKEVIGFDVSVYEVFGVNILDATNHLKEDKQFKVNSIVLDVEYILSTVQQTWGK